MNQPARMLIRASIFLIGILPFVSRGDALDHWTPGVFTTTNQSFTFPPGSNFVGYAESAAWGNGLFVVGGRYSCSVCYGDLPTMVLTSPDAEHWTEQNFRDYEGMQAMTFGDGRFVGVSAIGTGSHLKVSTNGINWMAPSLPVDPLLHAVAYGNGHFMAVGDAATLFSSNGVNWSSVTWGGTALDFGTPVGVGVTYGRQGFFGLAYTNGYFAPWLPPTSSQLRSSPSVFGVWSQPWIYYPPGAEPSPPYPPFPVFNDITFGNGVIVLAGSTILVATNNPVRALPFSPPTTNTINKVKFLAGIFVAFAGRELLTSVDGYNWINRGAIFPYPMSDITFGNGRFLVVGGTRYFLSDPFTGVTAKRPFGTLEISGAVDHTHQVQASETLAPDSWQVLTNLTLTNASQILFDSEATSFPQRFYRTQLLP